MSALTVRESGPHEAETLLAIQRAASLAGLAHVFPPEEYPYPEAEILDRWRAFEGCVWLAEQAGHPVGLAATEACWLAGLYVVPEEWGSGVAERLHAEAVSALRAFGCRQARLWVLEDNRRARSFYERRSWQLDEETRVVPYPPHPIDVSYVLTLPDPK